MSIEETKYGYSLLLQLFCNLNDAAQWIRGFIQQKGMLNLSQRFYVATATLRKSITKKTAAY
jgi:hypothetical protein